MYEAINVEDIANQALFKIVGASQLVSSGIFGYNPSIKRPAFNLDHAKSLMKEAGYENGFGFSLDYTDSPGAKELHQPLVDLLAKINVKVALQPVDPNKFFARVMKRDSSACILSWSTDSLDASEVLENLYHTRNDRYGSSNTSGYSNPALDKQIEEISTIMDPKIRLEKVQSALRIATEDLPAIPLHQVYSQWAISGDLSWAPRLDTTLRIYEMAGKAN
jgi:peptide/nickel transport system substrate-binding protein